MATSYGFRIVGACTEQRRLVDWRAAFSGYASCDTRAELHRESYLSAFTFGEDFSKHLDATGSTKGFDGICGADYIWWDLDRADLEIARRDAARLSLFITERYAINDGTLLAFFSGSKGFHIGIGTSLFGAKSSPVFHRVARRLAVALAEAAEVEIDVGVYDKVRAFRAPNSRHGNTGLHKRALSLDELTQLSIERIRELAQEPLAFDLPPIAEVCDRAVADWQEAAQRVDIEAVAIRDRRTTGNGVTQLNRQTLDFIRQGAGPGERHRLLFSAAANLAEFGCPVELAHQLLTEAALDSGLSPNETRRQIDCGLNHKPKGIES